MTALTFQPITPRPAPDRASGPVGWLRANLFSDWRTTVSTLIVGGVLLWYVPQLLRWALLQAVWLPSADACRAPGAGACWGVVAEKYRLIIFGRYPYEEQWRPLIATGLMVAALVASCMRAFWRPWLALLWAVVLAAFFMLMYGNVAGLSRVETDRWGGLPLTILLATLSIVLAFPINLVVALGRRSSLPAIRTFCTIYVELIRGVPLISVLFMASFMFPLFMPQGLTVDVLIRVLVGITLFAAAYLAEVVRGGLQAIPRGQYDAAHALALPYWRRTWLIILPQALRISVPPLVNTFIALFKDTSLVLIIGLFDLLSTIKISLTEPAWNGFGIEAYVFASLVYFAFCFAMSHYGKSFEQK